MRYTTLAFRTLSLLDLMSSSGISVMLSEWSLVTKCSDTVVCLEIIHGFSTCPQCSLLKRSLSRCVLFGVVVTVYHVNDVYGVTVISDRSGFLPVAWNVYEVCLSDMFLQVQRFFLHRYEPLVWLCCVRLWSLALTRKSLRLLLRL